MIFTKSAGNWRLNLLGYCTASALAVAALTVPLSPAGAQAYVQLGPFGFGVAPVPYYAPGYYYPYYPNYVPPPYYYYPY